MSAAPRRTIRIIRRAAACLSATFALAVSLPTEAQTTFCLAQELLPSDGGDHERYGHAVALSGNHLAIGKPSDTEFGMSAIGSVYIYSFDGVRWQFEDRLFAPDAADDDAFGSSLAFQQDRLVAGAPNHDHAATDAGSAYVFTRTPQGWQLEAELQPSDPSSQAYFGTSVAVDGNEIAVGAPAWLNFPPRTGSVYLYRFDGTAWHQIQKIQPDDPPTTDQGYGASVALDAGWLAVGTPLEIYGGVVYIYRKSAGLYQLHTTLRPGTNPWVEQFGHSLALRGGLLVVGAPQTGPPACTGSGSAHIYRLQPPDTWQPEADLAAADPGCGASFGHSLAILDPQTVVVGAPFHEHARPALNGSVYVFEHRENAAWTQIAELLPPRGEADSQIDPQFGYALAAQAPWIAVGAPRYNPTNTAYGGATMLFRRAACPADRDCDGDTDLADLAIVLSDFGCTSPPEPGCPGDVDGDTDTDLTDLALLLSQFGCGP